MLENSHLTNISLERSANTDLAMTTEVKNNILIQTLDKFDDGVYISNQDYSLLYTSPSLQDVFGPPGNKKCFDYLFNRDDACPWCRNQEVFSGKVISWEQSFDSFSKTYNIQEVPLYYPNKELRKITRYRDITDHKQSEKQLKLTHSNLIEEQVRLNKKNLALSEILRQIDYEKNLIKCQVQANINRIVKPLVDILRNNTNSDRDLYFGMLDDALNDITSKFMTKLELQFSSLSPRELEICNLIKNDLSSKQIADALNISIQTISQRRKHIRKKLGISNKKINLSAYLKSS